MNNVDKQYLALLDKILKNGVKKADRTGTGTLSIFGTHMEFDLSDGFPLLTTKKVYYHGVKVELLWFLGNHMSLDKYKPFGLTNIKFLIDNKVTIWNGDCYAYYKKQPIEDLLSEGWCKLTGTFTFPNVPEHYTREEFDSLLLTNDEFCKKWGNLGPVYGYQWTNWEKYEVLEERGWDTKLVRVKYVNQILNLLKDLKNNPDSRRLMVNAWNVGDIDEMKLPPCHYGFQCYTYENSEGKRVLELKWTQRSVDYFLGYSFNIASYATLLTLLAKELDMVPGRLIFSGGDTHLYLNHQDAAKEQLSREPFEELPSLEITDKSIFDLMPEDIKLVNYKSHSTIKAELSN